MIEILKAFVNDFTISEYISFIVALVLSLVGLAKFARDTLKTEKDEIIEKHLVTAETITAYVTDINRQIKHHPSLYKTLLENILNTLTKFLGELKLFSPKAFERHFIFSFIYSFFFFYIAWLFGGDGSIGEHQLMPNENRIGISLFLIFETVAIYYIVKDAENNKVYLAKKILYLNRWQELSVWIIIWVEWVLVGGGVVVGGGVGGVVVGVGIIGIVVEGLVGIVVVVVVVVGVIGVVVGINSKIILYLIFFLILPFINSIFDYISMYFSRFFAHKILQTNSKIKIVWDALLDLLVAVVLLYLLAQTLLYVIDLTNIYIIKERALFIPIDEYKTQLLSNPLNLDVLWITLMFISTLIPTILHLFLATYALLAYWLTKPHLHELVAKLKHLQPNDPNYLKKETVAKGLVAYRLSNMIKVYLIIGTLLIVLLTTVVLMLLLKKGLYVL